MSDSDPPLPPWQPPEFMLEAAVDAIEANAARWNLALAPAAVRELARAALVAGRTAMLERPFGQRHGAP